MIRDKNRTGWFGASDVSYIVGNYDTKTFAKWWLVKTGYTKNSFFNESMAAGTFFEHRILDYLHIPERDKQVLVECSRLRVNLDGNDDNTIYEVKTYNAEKEFKVPIGYKRQIWVQLYATGLRNAYLVAYGLEDRDYKNFFNAIDGSRLQLIRIEPNDEWIHNTFLPRLEYLNKCYEKGKMPSNEEYKNYEKILN